MRGRAPLAAITCLIVALTSACSASSHTTQSPTATPAHSTPTPTTSSSSSPIPIGNTTAVTAPAPNATSPALDKYSHRTVSAALDLAAHLAYNSVSDPILLGSTANHTSISDYADITKYLTPQGIAYLKSYVEDQNHNGKHQIIAGELAFANVPLAAGVGKQASATSGTRFDTPFAPRNYQATINPTVGLSQDGASMAVTGRCSVQIPGTRAGKHFLITLTRKSFTYYVQAKASATAPVGVYGWISNSTATYVPQ